MFVFFIITAIIGFYITKMKLNLEKTGVLVGTFGAPILIFLALTHLKLTIWIVLIIGLFLFVCHYFMVNSERQEWRKRKYEPITPYDFVEFAEANSNGVDEEGNRIIYKDNLNDIPYNRAMFFENGSSLEKDQKEIFPMYYDFSPSDKDVSLREYGYLVTTVEVIVKNQITETKKRGEKTYKSQDIFLPFQGIYKVEQNSSKLTVYYDKKPNQTVALKNAAVARFLNNIFQTAIKSGWTKNCNQVIERLDRDDKQSVENQIDSETKNMRINSDNGSYVKNSAVNNSINFRKTLQTNQINDRFGGGQGHGHVGEQYGDTRDGLLGRRTSMVGGTHEKWGADRIVNGKYIQTKYNSTAGKSVGQMFDGHTAKYIDPNTGKMMPVEVPSDQVNGSIKAMSKRIQNGEVPGESNPQNAYKYVKKGALTYEHSKIATQSIFDRHSTITINNQVREVSFGQKLIYSAGGDFATGVKNGMPAALVTGVWVFCNNVWQGKDLKDSAKNAAKVSGTSLLVGGSLSMLSFQLGGSKFATKHFGQQFGKALEKNEIGNEVLGVASIAIVMGPDIVNVLRGRISMKQLTKDAAVFGASGLLTAAMAASFAFGPIGTAVVGTVSYAGTKMLADHFVEDDAITMTRILKEEFINTVFYAPLAPDEFSKIQSSIFDSKKTPKLLKTMYASGNPRNFIHDLLNGMITDKFKARPIDEDVIINTFQNTNGAFEMA